MLTKAASNRSIILHQNTKYWIWAFWVQNISWVQFFLEPLITLLNTYIQCQTKIIKTYILTVHHSCFPCFPCFLFQLLIIYQFVYFRTTPKKERKIKISINIYQQFFSFFIEFNNFLLFFLPFQLQKKTQIMVVILMISIVKKQFLFFLFHFL